MKNLGTNSITRSFNGTGFTPNLVEIWESNVPLPPWFRRLCIRLCLADSADWRRQLLRWRRSDSFTRTKNPYAFPIGILRKRKKNLKTLKKRKKVTGPRPRPPVTTFFLFQNFHINLCIRFLLHSFIAKSKNDIGGLSQNVSTRIM